MSNWRANWCTTELADLGVASVQVLFQQVYMCTWCWVMSRATHSLSHHIQVLSSDYTIDATQSQAVMLVMVAPRHTPGLIKNYKSCKNLCTKQKIIESTFKYPLFLKNECLPIVDMGSIQETIKFNIKHIPTTVDNVSFLYNKFCSHTSVIL